jgi:hypothetical protein
VDDQSIGAGCEACDNTAEKSVEPMQGRNNKRKAAMSGDRIGAAKTGQHLTGDNALGKHHFFTGKSEKRIPERRK